MYKQLSCICKNVIVQSLTINFLFYILFNSCAPGSNTTGRLNEKQTLIVPAKEAVDGNFNDFIEKFSSDSVFQLNRIHFPLKIKWYDVKNDRITLIYKDRSSFGRVDFSEKQTKHHTQWEQKMVVEKNNQSATIEIRGIENGIMVDYLFSKVNGTWMLIEIDDNST